MFDSFDPKVHITPYPQDLDPDAKYYRIGGDWGTASPSAAILLHQLPNGDIIALDETDTADPQDLSTGLGHAPDQVADLIQEMITRNKIKGKPVVIIDDMRGLSGDTVVKIFRESGLRARKPGKKNRVAGWVVINQMLHNAKIKEGPGLYFTNRCPHLLSTLPEAPRGTLRAEDIDPKYRCDHHLDALSYGLSSIIRPTPFGPQTITIRR